jgi:hypothetical protein
MIGIIIAIVVIVIVGVLAYSYINNIKNSCFIMDDSKCNIDTDCKKAGCSCINKLEIMNISGGSCNTLVAFDCKCENNICKSESIIPNNNKSVCGNGICEGPACPTCDTPGNCGACATGTCPEDCASGGPIKYGECGDGVCDYGENTSSYPYYCPQDCDESGNSNNTKFHCTTPSDCVSQCSQGCVNKEWNNNHPDHSECERAWDCSCVNNLCYSDGNSPHICPTQKIIDCMPSVGDEVVQYCSGENHNWIIENCNISFSY